MPPLGLLPLPPMLGQETDMPLPTLAKMGADNGSSQSFASGNAFVTITGWTSLFDTLSAFVAATGLYTAPADGYYLVTAGIFTNTIPQNADLFLSVFVSAAEKVRQAITTPATGGALGNGAINLGITVPASKNDVIRLAVTNFTGSTVALNNQPLSTYWSIAQQL